MDCPKLLPVQREIEACLKRGSSWRSSTGGEGETMSVATGLMERDDGEQRVGPSNRQLRRSLYICAVAFMMNYAAYGGLMFLQSSINIKQGLGTIGLFAIYATSSFSSLFVIPFLIDFKGAKVAIVLGEIGILLYTVANFYPSWYTIIPAAICHGFTESASWAGTSVYVTYLGEKYSENICRKSDVVPRKKDKESCVYNFFSVFYIFVYLSQVIGNALVSVVLYGARKTEPTPSTLSSERYFTGNTSEPGVEFWNFTTESTVAWPTKKNLQPWEICGAEECQADFIYNATEVSFKKYEPGDSSVNLLLSLFVAMQVIFTLVHAFALPAIPSKLSVATLHSAQTTAVGKEVAECPREDDCPFSSALLLQVKAELKETLYHMISPLHILVFPMIFYVGVTVAFNVAEFTRAYVSCTIGVENVGFVAMVYGLSSMLVSSLSSKLIPRFGRNSFVVVMVLAHTGTYLFSLLWTPTAESPWLIYLNSICLGASDGITTNIVQGMFAIYFEDRVAIAFSVKNFGTNLGVVAGTGYSTSLCVKWKIYIIFALLTFSTVAYVGAEKLHHQKCRRAKAQRDAAAQDDEVSHTAVSLA